MSGHKFVLFDSEFTAWEGSFERKWSESWEHKEIIQISAMLLCLENEFVIEDEINILVKPSINKTLSGYIKNLTGISQDDIDKKGISFLEALDQFKKFSATANGEIFCWGSDEKAFRETCKLNNIQFSDYFNCFYDIRDAFKRASINVEKYQSGNVYNSVGAKFENFHQHDASNDVKSMLVTLQHLHGNQKLKKEMLNNCSISNAVL